jgi:membrane-associated protease RseP (regulator of RpoE activity)
MRAKLMLTLAAATLVLSPLVPQARAAEGLLGVHLVQDGNRVVITQVIGGTSAAQVGIQPGDVLAKVGTTDIYTIQDALDAKKAAPEGVDVPMVILTPHGPWPINAQFGGGTVLYFAKDPRPQTGSSGGRPAVNPPAKPAPRPTIKPPAKPTIKPPRP